MRGRTTHKVLRPKRIRSYRNTLQELISIHGCVCWYCGIELTDSIHIDHITPKSRGGDNKIGNYALSCPMCNYAKRNLDVLDFLYWLSHIRSSNFHCYIIEHLKVDLDLIKGDRLQKDFY